MTHTRSNDSITHYYINGLGILSGVNNFISKFHGNVLGQMIELVKGMNFITTTFMSCNRRNKIR